jgi:hypothetical protein
VCQTTRFKYCGVGRQWQRWCGAYQMNSQTCGNNMTRGVEERCSCRSRGGLALKSTWWSISNFVPLWLNALDARVRSRGRERDWTEQPIGCYYSSTPPQFSDAYKILHKERSKSFCYPGDHCGYWLPRPPPPPLPTSLHTALPSWLVYCLVFVVPLSFLCSALTLGSNSFTLLWSCERRHFCINVF